MTSYSVNLPLQLQEEVEKCALVQGIPPDQFILWAVAEKVAVLQHQFPDRSLPHITYRTGASGSPVAVIRGTRIRVQTIAIATHQWGMSPQQLAEEYGLTETQINDALLFYTAHQTEIDRAIAAEQEMETFVMSRINKGNYEKETKMPYIL
ncbi:MAG TPA: DUF433 domain-containing protein [Oscillatoriaceae cyanobacterium M33_DOE_052]|uniref:DUF433 domain-containing protein n=1 Tax=Planktothricoides sp. SpSt-374 TaxID=2282167 RepID=A0A7C3VQ67_9CYAN|nr:DUF433 domain-containing protein [Oscillatoriaceae cyanobacterium M33_DOE_052]